MKKEKLKIIIRLVIILLLVLCFGQAFAEPCGDVNSSGAINIVDALLIAQYYVGLNPPNFDSMAADVNADGKINIVDALLIAQYYVGLITELPGCVETPEPTDDPTPSPTPDPNAANAFNRIEAESYTEMNGIQTETCDEGGENIGYIENGNYTAYILNFTDTPSQIEVRVASETSGGTIEVRLGSTSGNLISTVNVGGTGGWQSWQTVTTSVSSVSGVQTVYLVFNGGEGYLFNFNWFTFISGTPAPTPTQAPTPDINDGPVGFATLNGGTTGGQGGQTVTASSYNQLKSYAESSTTYIIMVEGTISNGSGGGTVSVRSNKSIIGIGSTAFLNGVSLSIRNNNIIIRNLRITLVGTSNPGSINDGDTINITGSAKNIWIDHCELFSEDPAVQPDIDKYDGLIDIRDQTGFITISWNYMHDHHKCGIVGHSDSDLYADRKITFHHNYYNKVKYRMPMYRGSIGHFFNNYIVGAQDATEIREGTCVRVEKNYYEKLHYSIYTPTDHPGKTERIDNIEVERASRAYPANCTADIPYDYSSVLTGNTQDVKTVVPQGAGVGKI